MYFLFILYIISKRENKHKKGIRKPKTLKDVMYASPSVVTPLYALLYYYLYFSYYLGTVIKG